MSHRAKLFCDRSNQCLDLAIFWLLKCRPPAILYFKIRNFVGQISKRSVKPLLKYGDLTVLKMAAGRHVGFLKFQMLSTYYVQMVNM